MPYIHLAVVQATQDQVMMHGCLPRRGTPQFGIVRALTVARLRNPVATA